MRILQKNELTKKTLDALKERLDENNSMLVQQPKGVLLRRIFEFNPPLTEENIIEFSLEQNLHLPEDYRQFLLMHNGASLFGGEYGGSIIIFRLEDVRSYLHNGLPSKWLPIATILGATLFADCGRYENGEDEYLFIHEDGEKYEEAWNLQSNFEIWLDRLIVSQGSQYWRWPILTPQKFYKKIKRSVFEP